MKQSFKNIFRILSGLLLTALGFSSCDGNVIGGGREEYGCPNADYRLLGNVTDESGKPIKNIQVAAEFQVSEKDPKYFDRDTLYTDANGSFDKTVNTFPNDYTVKVTFNDIDGSANDGDFESSSLSVTPVQTKKGNGNWYNGVFSAQADAKLKKK